VRPSNLSSWIYRELWGCFRRLWTPTAGGRVKVPHHFTTGGDGTSEIDPDAVVGEVEQILNEFAIRPVAGRTRGVALDTFASSLGV
jgi:gluconokinase